MLENAMTPDEHREFLRRTVAAHEEIHGKLAAQVAALQNEIHSYDPVALMHRAAYMLLPLLMKYRSEDEFTAEEGLYLPALEYLQYLVARTEPNTSGAEPAEGEWEGVWRLALDALRLTQQYLFTRKSQTSLPSEIDGLRFVVDHARLGIRIKRYPLFLVDCWRESLQCYEPWIKKVYGIGVDDLIRGFQAIEDYQRRGAIDRYGDFMRATEMLTERLRAKGYVVDPDAADEEVKRTRQALASDEFREAHTEAEEKARLALTPAIFDITDVSLLPKAVLAVLSVRPGQAALRDSDLTQHDDLSPLATSLLHYKPFLQAGGRFYFFYHSGFEDWSAELIGADLLARRPGEATPIKKRQSDQLERLAGDLMRRVLKPDFVVHQAHYPNPDQPGDLTELDILLGVDDLLFLIEVKSGGLSAASARGAPKSLAGDLSELIIAGQRQSERAERYIRSQRKVAFSDESGKNVIYTLRVADYRRVFRIVVTREALGWVGARLAVLSVLDPGLSRSFPWHISIDDLRAVVELFEGKELEFAHFLDQRLKASAEAALVQHDELEHVALYLKRNQYHQLPVKGVDLVSFTSYMNDIDTYFTERYSGEAPARPKQKLPPRMSGLLEALAASGLRGRFEAASVLLAMGQAGRDELETNLGTLKDRLSAGRQPSIHMPFGDDSLGISISYASDQNLREELLRCAARMRRGGNTRWLVVHLENHSAYRVKGVHVITPDSFSEAELSHGLAHLETEVTKTTKTRKVGRNERCPCGSGQKYKRCHGYPTRGDGP
jgi:hypothetical protein